MFCEATMRQCYILNTTAASFADARAACQALGGDSDLVQFTNGVWRCYRCVRCRVVLAG
jgi:heterodisulfide reductase subunit C